MKRNLLLFISFSLMLVSSVNSQPVLDKEDFLLSANIRLLNQYHFLKKPINNELFNQIFTNYLEDIDPYKTFLTQNEVSELSNFKIPQENLENVLAIPAYTEEFINDRIKLLRTETRKITAQPIDFSIDEQFNSDYSELPYAKNEADILERWRKRFKYQILVQALAKILPDTNFTRAITPTANDPTTSQTLEETLATTQKEITESTQRFLSTIEALKRNDYVNSYINAIGRTYDEYTTYLPPVQKETFDIRLSGQLEGIGAEIRKAGDGLIEIVRIVPGGASYRQKQLEAGDKIMKVAQNQNDPVDIRNSSLDEVLKLIRGKKGTLVNLTVKKASGEIIVIPIVRDKIILEETYARSTVISINQQRYGYLYLPKFYRNFNDKNERTSTEDVRKELIYLNQQNVSGLVFDIRNNGGGSLEDAILMTGLFINEGPIIRVRDNTREYPAYRDKDKAIVFSKPMVVLVNYGSASASEIFAAAMQDYKRAIIVGEGPKTFGKGTVQTLFSLNKIPEARLYAEELGYLKFTIQKYYRITGESTQNQGVRPDIILPNLSILPTNTKSAYTNDSLTPIIFPKWNAFTYSTTTLIENSAARINKNPLFRNIQKRSEIIQSQQNQKIFSLNYQKALKKRQSSLKKIAQYKVDLNQPLNFNVLKKNLTTNNLNESGAQEKQKQFNQWYENLKKDIYLQESLEILTDAVKT